jgi:solute carrier family 25 protein 38
MSSADSREHKRLANFLAGALSGLTTTLALQPLDVVKTRMQQTMLFSKTVGLLDESRVRFDPNRAQLRKPPFRPGKAWRAARSVVEENGLLGLWRGTTPTILRNMMGVGVYFVTLNQLATRLRGSDPELAPQYALLAGATARSVSATLLCPLTVIKARFEAAGPREYRHVFDALYKIGRYEGIRGLFSGLLPTVLRDAPYSALYVFIYLRTRDRAQELAPNVNSMVISFTSGFVGGGLSTLLTQPQDVVKTRMQLARHVELERDQYATVRMAIRRIWREEGMFGFFRGASPRILKRCLGSAITWMIYEEVVVVIDRLLGAAIPAPGTSPAALCTSADTKTRHGGTRQTAAAAAAVVGSPGASQR